MSLSDNKCHAFLGSGHLVPRSHAGTGLKVRGQHNGTSLASILQVYLCGDPLGRTLGTAARNRVNIYFLEVKSHEQSKGVHPDRTHDRGRDHRHPGRHCDPGL